VVAAVVVVVVVVAGIVVSSAATTIATFISLSSVVAVDAASVAMAMILSSTINCTFLRALDDVADVEVNVGVVGVGI